MVAEASARAPNVMMEAMAKVTMPITHMRELQAGGQHKGPFFFTPDSSIL